MKKLNKFIKPTIIFIISIILIPLILALINIFNIKTTKIEIIIISSILMLFLGFIIGKKSKNKGYLNGILLSCICISIMLILSIIFSFKLNINSLIYYIIILFSTVFGSMLGISKNNK